MTFVYNNPKDLDPTVTDRVRIYAVASLLCVDQTHRREKLLDTVHITKKVAVLIELSFYLANRSSLTVTS